MSKDLADLFNKYKCDKASKHHYHTVYGPELDDLHGKPINILEVGVFKGASAQAWLDYFPEATVYGIDIFTRVLPKDIPVLNHPRMKWLQGDSTNLDIISKVKQEWPNTLFDVIIDDGLHTPAANALTLGNMFNLLKATGKYFIEDVWALEEMTKQELGHPWIKQHREDLNVLEAQKLLNVLADKKVERFDLRAQTNQPESYIIKVTK